MISDRIQRARLLRGLSLEALAQRLGDITKQALSKFEKGEAVPNSTRIVQLARALGVKPEYFFRADGVELAQVEFRKLSNMSGRDQTSVIEQARDHLERYLALEQCFEAAGVSLKPPLAGFLPVKNREEAEVAAEKLREEWRLGSDAIANFTELLEEHGIKVALLDGIEKFDGACVATQDKQHVLVALNRQRPGERQRFTAAHELGHWVMAIPEDMPEKEKEACCHRFAGALLYPKERVKADFGGHPRHRVLFQELMLAKRGYGVSMQVALRRLKDLGLVGESLFKSLHIQMGQRGWRTAEPEPMAAENPLRFTSLVYWGLAEGLFTPSRAAEFLQQPVSALDTEASVTLEA
ncbi:helix-turn-helix domain-containing protein [Paraburkholderia ginsengisoli]|uniref:ImmA/IrrE family metallo-endopeptidase n=1 Tax=Paraburkholderia ginsengisoli TaxID=311231 RepID=A0A7T4N207_9BURK|nr:XRE family transcriptional regulator [Paraburkholderia ginsengisoli]QQC63807.1 ImmA/IrrE family metallo-endopeptidase [Paraburkholderia ginsengisoli]